MYYLEIALKLIVSLSILNVWLLRANKSTPYRGGQANSIKEEFEVYGLPGWFVGVIGVLKVGLALALIASIWLSVLEMYSALGIAFLMLGAVIMHIKVSDPIKKAFPAALFLILSVTIYFI